MLPGFTVLMPTFNSAGRVRRCLDSIKAQDYDGSRVQVIIADGGSTDDTVSIAKEYGAQVVDNPLKLAEEGLRVGMPHVEREFLVIFADDNELAQRDWMSTVESILRENPAAAAFWCRLGASEDDPAVNKYYALIESEPLSFFINRNLSKYMRESQGRLCNDYSFHVFDIRPSMPLVWGANGLTFRSELIKPIWKTDAYLGDNDAFQMMLERGDTRAAYSRDLCVYHHHVRKLWTWREKWARNFEKHFLGNLQSRNLNWLFVPHFKLKAAAWALYSLVPVVSVPVALYRAFRDRDWHWLYHPAASFLQAATYTKILLTTPAGRDYIRQNLPWGNGSKD
jgi:glycosyltransferase involved in cell wall biosynthesis